MNHEEIKQRLWALYDGQLPEAERAPLESHLKDCQECCLALSEWQSAALDLFSRPEPIGVDSDLFTQKVMARVQALPSYPAPSGWRIFFPWAAPVLGSAALAAWVFFSVIPGTPGLSSGTALEDFFPSDSAALSTPTWTGTTAASSEEEIIQVMLKE